MNVERQIIGSLLIDQSRIEDMHLINSEMFTDPLMGQIYSMYEHANGKEISPLTIIPLIKSDFLTELEANKLLNSIVSDHDAGISDKRVCEIIYDGYRKRKLDEYITNIQLSPQTIDNTIDDFKELLDGLGKPEEAKAKTLCDLTASYKDNYFKDKGNKGFNTGFSKIDKAIGGLDGGDLIIIAARPGVGKSAFTLQFIRKLGKEGNKVGYFNLEMAEKQIYERAIASTSGIDMTRIRLATTFLNDEQKKFDAGNGILEGEKNVYVYTGAQTVNSIRATQKKEQFSIIFIDYLQLIQSINKRQNRSAEVGDISRGLKSIATDFNIPVVALSQLNRVSEMNRDKEPSMSELRESGDLEQDAAVIIMIWNPNSEDSSEKMIKVEKSRNGYLDRETLYFDGKHMTFTSLDFKDVEEDQDDIPFD